MARLADHRQEAAGGDEPGENVVLDLPGDARLGGTVAADGEDLPVVIEHLLKGDRGSIGRKRGCGNGVGGALEELRLAGRAGDHIEGEQRAFVPDVGDGRAVGRDGPGVAAVLTALRRRHIEEAEARAPRAAAGWEAGQRTAPSERVDQQPAVPRGVGFRRVRRSIHLGRSGAEANHLGARLARLGGDRQHAAGSGRDVHQRRLHEAAVVQGAFGAGRQLPNDDRRGARRRAARREVGHAPAVGAEDEPPALQLRDRRRSIGGDQVRHPRDARVRLENERITAG